LLDYVRSDQNSSFELNAAEEDLEGFIGL